jgi:hypothetical protein
VVAFAVIGPVPPVMVIASVIAAAVIAGYLRIGVLKSIGFTPRGSPSPSGPDWPARAGWRARAAAGERR